MELPLESAGSLRQANREPAVTFQIELDGGKVLVLQKLLRILPGKRITGMGIIDGQTVLAKLFIAQRDSERHWQREYQGVELLQSRDLPTPKLLSAGALHNGGHYVLTTFEGAQSLSVFGDALPPFALMRLFNTLGRMHAKGLIHTDAHLGNFLLKEGDLFILDGDAVCSKQLAADVTANLALLLAQLPPKIANGMQAELLAAYRDGNPDWLPNLALINQAVTDARLRRLESYLDKCLRDCSRFKVEREHGRFISMVRSEADFLAPIIADPDAWLNAGTPLKQGNTATLAMVEHEGRKLVIKRYNIKGLRHALSRCWRPSRAWHSWVEGHRLGFLGIATPRPLAMIEQRFGPLRGRAWIMVDYCAGESLAAHFAPFVGLAAPAEEMQAVQDLFGKLAAARISHGDLKASNLLWYESRVCLIDLDATRQHQSGTSFARALQKDRTRFLQNWPEGSVLRRAMETVIPSA
jgi:tRNA A-37 threonylcarbamoyl transferase component Bud32